MQKITTVLWSFLLWGLVMLHCEEMHAQLKANFSISQDTVCANLVDSFPSATSGGTLPYTYTWDYGNKTNSSAQNGYANYSSEGSYKIKLRVTDAKGNKDSITKTITVLGSPIADYSAYVAHCTYVIYNVGEDSLTPTSIRNYLIVGESAPGLPPLYITNQTGSMDYVKGGTYHYSIEVTGANGCRTIYNDSVRVPTPPFLYFNPDTSVCLNSTITINATPKNGTPPFSILLGFSDTSTITTTIVQDTILPIYITDAKGCYLFDTIYIHAIPLPKADYSATKPECGVALYRASEDSLSQTKITKYMWVGQGDPGFAPLYMITDSGEYLYTRGGTYHYSLIVTGANGCTAFYADSIKMPTFPAITLPYNFSVCQNSTTTITATPSGGTPPYTIWWDHKSANLTGPSIHPAITKDTAFAVHVLDSNHCYNYDSIWISTYPLPNARWTMDYNGNNTDFRAVDSSHAASSYRWFFGDGDSATSYDVSHIYPNRKMYDVSLIVGNNNGCFSSYDSFINTGNFSFYLYPNPFHISASVQYVLAQKTNVQIILYNITGKVVARLTDEIQLPGSHQVEINSYKPDLAPGTYFLKFITDDANIMKPILKL